MEAFPEGLEAPEGVLEDRRDPYLASLSAVKLAIGDPDRAKEVVMYLRRYRAGLAEFGKTFPKG